MKKLVVAFALMVVLSMLALPFFGRLQASTSSHTQTNTDSSWMEEQKDISFKSAMPYENHSATSENSGVSPFIIPIPPGGDGGGSGGGGGGGSPPVSISLKIDIFQGQAEIDVGNNQGSNGATFTLSPYSSYQIYIISVSSGYKFFQWKMNTGYVDNPESSGTTLHTGGSSGTLALVLNNTASTISWAGFVQSGSISSVTGEFYVPWATYIAGQKSSPDIMNIWIGIGGFGNNNLWQGGIEIDVSLSGAETVTAWYTDYSVNPNEQSIGGMQINPGDLVQLWTNYSASNGISTFKILDRTNGQTAPTITISYTPDGGTAEWIVEDATQGSYTMPNYNTVAWTKASSNGGNLITPLSAAIHEVKWTSNANHEGPDEVSNAQYITEPNQFSVTFWGYNG